MTLRNENGKKAERNKEFVEHTICGASVTEATEATTAFKCCCGGPRYTRTAYTRTTLHQHTLQCSLRIQISLAQQLPTLLAASRQWPTTQLFVGKVQKCNDRANPFDIMRRALFHFHWHTDASSCKSVQPNSKMAKAGNRLECARRACWHSWCR